MIWKIQLSNYYFAKILTYTFQYMRRNSMKKQYETPTIDTILFEEKRNVITLSLEDAGDDNYTGGDWES